jgi:hypothetical protein
VWHLNLIVLCTKFRMASSASATPAKPDSAEPENAAVVAGPRSRLQITVRLADIIQLNINIGRSRFGEVKLAKSRQTDDIYALKALRKSRFGSLT